MNAATITAAFLMPEKEKCRIPAGDPVKRKEIKGVNKSSGAALLLFINELLFRREINEEFFTSSLNSSIRYQPALVLMWAIFVKIWADWDQYVKNQRG